MVQFYSQSREGGDPRTNVLVQVHRQKKKKQPKTITGQARGAAPFFKECQVFVLFRASVDWRKTTHIGEDSLPDSVYQFKCESHLETSPQTHSQ